MISLKGYKILRMKCRGELLLAEVSDDNHIFFLKSNVIDKPLGRLDREMLQELEYEQRILKKVRGIEGLMKVKESVLQESPFSYQSHVVAKKYEEIYKKSNPESIKADDLFYSCLRPITDLHKMGIFHNDLTPWNIMADGPNFVIIDFGGANFGEGLRFNSFEFGFRVPSRKNDISMLLKASLHLEHFPGMGVRETDWESVLLKTDIRGKEMLVDLLYPPRPENEESMPIGGKGRFI